MEEISIRKTAEYSGLSSVKMRRRSGLFVASGGKCVLDLLGVFPLEALVATEGWFESHPEAVRLGAGRCRLAAFPALRKISQMQAPPEVVAVFRIPEQPGTPAISPDELVLALDGVQDPGNLGSIIRTALWFGVRKMLLSKDCCDIYNPKTVMATMGALGKLQVYTVDLHNFLKSSGMPVYGTLLNGSDIFTAHLTKGGIVVMGNEGNGLSAKVRESVDFPLLIPPYGPGAHGESLNVGAATAIVLAEFRRRGTSD